MYKKKKEAGIVLIIIGLIFSISEGFDFTGKVLGGYSPVGMKFIIVVLFIAGIFLFNTSLETKVGYELSNQEKEQIKNAFKTGDKKKIKAVFKKYQLIDFGTSGKHQKVGYNNAERKLTISVTPGDHRAGLNIAKDVIKYIEIYFNQ